MTEQIIGIDCATQPNRTGLARAERVQDRYEVQELMVCSGEQHPVEVVMEWLGEKKTALLALDAPLGWPVSLGRELARHSAGDAIMIPGELLFRRLTDREVARNVGKTPLEIGADRIARTAHSALLLLEHVRVGIGEPIPLAWETPIQDRIAAIEVYPAATMLVRGGSLRGYKKKDAVPERAKLLEGLAPSCDFQAVKEAALANHDCLDALACVVAGLEFLQGQAVSPREPDVARREGWIWFREPGSV